MAGRIDARLAELGYTIPVPVEPAGNYVGYVITGNLVFTAGQVPVENGERRYIGRLGREFTVEQGQKAAELAALSVLARVKAACGGDLDRVQQVVRLGGFIAAPAAFSQHALVMNGASDLAVAVFGEAGRHARSTIGVPSLPADAAVEVEGMFEIE